MIRARLQTDALDAPALLASFLAALGHERGAVVSFLGLTRSYGHDGVPVDTLFLDHHPRMTETSLRDIAAAAAERFEVGAIDILHRHGTIAAGEAIVWVAAAARHRRAAFEATDYIMDRLKTEAVLWKRENGGGETRWIEPTRVDHDSRARWQSGE